MLPSDRYLAEVLGLTEEQYRHFQIEVRKRAAEGPQPAVVAGIDPVTLAVTLVVGVGLQIVSSLLKPSAPRVGQQALDHPVNNKRAPILLSVIAGLPLAMDLTVSKI